MANTNDAHEFDMGDDLEITKVSRRARKRHLGFRHECRLAVLSVPTFCTFPGELSTAWAAGFLGDSVTGG